MSHLARTLAEMENVINRARIRDAGRIRAHKYALALALVAPEILADPGIDEKHKDDVRTVLAECRALAVGSRADINPEALLAGIPLDDVLAPIRAEVELEIKGDS